MKVPQFSTSQYQTIIELLPDPIIVYCDLRLVYVNQEGVALFGAEDKEQLIGKHILEFTPPEYHDHILQQIEEFLRIGEPGPQYQIEEWYRMDGRKVTVTLRAIPAIYENRPALTLLCKDITEKVTAQETLEKNKMFLQQMMKLSPGAIVIHSDDIIHYANNSAVQLARGSYESDLIGKSIYQFFEPEEHHKIESYLKKAGQAKQPLEMITRHALRLNGERFVAEMSTIMICDDNGKSYYQTVVRDISEQTAHEQMLLGMSKRYETLIKFLPEPIVISEDGLIVYTNQSLVKLLKAEHRDQILGKSVYDITHPDYHEDSRKVIKKVMRSEKPSPFSERKLICCDGETVSVEISSIQIYNYNGKPAMLSVIRDLSERKRSEELLLRSEKLSVIGQLAAGVAHEIRNPLTALKGFTQILQKELGSKYYYIGTMMSELERIQYIVNEFMSLAKPQLITFRCHRIMELLRSVISLLEAEAIIYNVSIQLNTDGTDPVVNCDENRMKQVFVNTIKNAIEAMPHGGTVTIQTETLGKAMRISIQDEGVGIPKEIIQNIGEPFFTTKENGNGLGLMICRRILEAHNGSLHITSKQNIGTTVLIELPIT